MRPNNPIHISLNNHPVGAVRVRPTIGIHTCLESCHITPNQREDGHGGSFGENRVATPLILAHRQNRAQVEATRVTETGHPKG